MIALRSLVKNNFDKASSSYDSVAFAQREAADFLVQRLLERPIGTPKTILDLGTGTGYIAKLLLRQFPSAAYCLNDISDKMLAVCQETFAHQKNFNFLLADLETLSPASYELIISNLALQWSSQIGDLIKKFSTQTNIFAFSTLLDGTFQTWNTIIHGYNDIALKKYPTTEELAEYCYAIEGEGTFTHWVKIIPVTLGSPLLFMHYLKKLGATAERRRVSIRTLRTVLREHPGPITVHYKIFFGIFIRGV